MVEEKEDMVFSELDRRKELVYSKVDEWFERNKSFVGILLVILGTCLAAVAVCWLVQNWYSGL